MAANAQSANGQSAKVVRTTVGIMPAAQQALEKISDCMPGAPKGDVINAALLITASLLQYRNSRGELRVVTPEEKTVNVVPVMFTVSRLR